MGPHYNQVNRLTCFRSENRYKFQEGFLQRKPETKSETKSEKTSDLIGQIGPCSIP